MSVERVALDTNALRALIAHDPAMLAALGEALPALPVVVLEETAQGWLLKVRKAQQASREDIVGLALDQLADAYAMARLTPLLRYTPEAQALFRQLRVGRGNRGKQDLRIAAICLAHQIPLLTRNRSDFDDIEGFRLIGW
jgi:tRNA(fMet)-specific endonuclease VapC